MTKNCQRYKMIRANKIKQNPIILAGKKKN